MIEDDLLELSAILHHVDEVLGERLRIALDRCHAAISRAELKGWDIRAREWWFFGKLEAEALWYAMTREHLEVHRISEKWDGPQHGLPLVRTPKDITFRKLQSMKEGDD